MFFGRREDDGHCLGMHTRDLHVRFGRQEREYVGGDLAFLRLPHARPARPESSEAE